MMRTRQCPNCGGRLFYKPEAGGRGCVFCYCLWAVPEYEDDPDISVCLRRACGSAPQTEAEYRRREAVRWARATTVAAPSS